jgi:hypothetical protein
LPRTPDRVPGVAGVEFRTARQVGQPNAIGNLDTRNCYTVRYHPESKTYESWFSAPPPRSGNKESNTKANLPGDPSRNEVNVYGVILLFNEAGEVLDRKGNVVGKLVCYLSDECGSY